MGDPSTFHFEILLTAFQLAAAALVYLRSQALWPARAGAAALLAANGVIPVLSALGSRDPEGPWQRLASMADLPTPAILLLLVLWFPAPRGSPAMRRAATLALGALGSAAFLYAALGDPWTLSGPLILLQFVATVCAYGVSIALLALDFRNTGSPAAQWMLAAIGVRACEFAVYFATAEGWWAPASWFLALSALFVAVALALPSRPPVGERATVLLVLGAGAVLGAVRRWSAKDTGLFEGLITLAIVRPGLMVVAMAPPGTIGGFFARVLAGLVAYAGTVLLVRQLGLSFSASFVAETAVAVAMGAVAIGVAEFLGRTHAATDSAWTGPSNVDPRRLQGNPARLVKTLASLPPGARMSRADLAESLGVLPRNVHRLAEAANRLPGAREDAPFVRWVIARGKANQLQYHYEATERARALVGAQLDRQNSTNPSISRE